MSLVQSLGYIGLDVADPEAWSRYAGDVLGLQAVARDDGSVDLRMDVYASRLRLHKSDRDDVRYVGWEVRDDAALRALAERLSAAGVEVIRGTDEEARDRRVERLIRFQDPEGLSCEVFFGALQRTDNPFVSPRGVKFKTGAQGLGHVVLVARDAKAQERFYIEVLGFRLSDYIRTEVVPGRRNEFTFMRCNTRHHSLALITVPLPKKLQHIMLEVEALDDVGRALDRCQAGAHHISLTLGRHSNDDMLSFYTTTPSGFDVEYGWGGLAVEDDDWHVVTHEASSAWGHRFQRPPRPPA